MFSFKFSLLVNIFVSTSDYFIKMPTYIGIYFQNQYTNIQIFLCAIRFKIVQQLCIRILYTNYLCTYNLRVDNIVF